MQHFSAKVLRRCVYESSEQTVDSEHVRSNRCWGNYVFLGWPLSALGGGLVSMDSY